MSISPYTETPNAVVTNPIIRKAVGNTLGVASVLLSVATLVDGAITELDYGFITGPAAVIIAGLFGIFQLGVTSPNVPTPKALEDIRNEETDAAFIAERKRADQAAIDAQYGGDV